MNQWHKTLCVMALALQHFTLLAGNQQEGWAFCQAQQATASPPCHLQPCPCGPGEVTLKRFEDPVEAPSLCACRSPQAKRHHTRQQAAAACDNYRRSERKSCFVSRGDCPGGFTALADFNDESGNRFTACRDNRHERPRQVSPDLHGLSRQQLLRQYARLISHLDSQRAGPPQPLPQATRDRLGTYFHAFSLESFTLVRTRALSRGCFNDCERVFCAADTPIEQWLDREQPLISRNLLHLIEHAASCQRVGGRERFVDNWFRYLPDDVYRQLQAGEPIDTKRLHFSMYLESHAEHRAEHLCRQLPDCRLE